MKQQPTAWGAAALAVSLGIGLVGGLALRETASREELHVNEPAASIAAERISPKPRYLLKGYEGKLAVFIIGKEEPELVLDRYLHHLPDVDRLKLEEGIEVVEYADLLRLIEDYTS